MPSLSSKLTPSYHLPLPGQFVDRMTPLAEVMPERQPIELRTEADFYGASWEVARALGLQEPPRAIASWFHGFIHRLVSPNQFLWNDENTELQQHLVSTQKEAGYMTGHGHANTHAVGAPFLYATSPAVPRIPRSLLVAPGLNRHLLAPFSEQLDRTLDHLRPLRSKFDFVLCCLKARLIWAPGLADVLVKHDIPWVEGAEFSDANALKRMRTLYSSFEVVMSDTVGAHLAQASLCGARTCVFGPAPKLDRALLTKALDASCERVRQDPRMLDSFVDNPDHYRERLPFLFRSPDEAGSFPEWGGEVLGVAHKRPDAEIARLLGWHHCPGSPGFANAEHAEMAGVLGWLPAAAVSPHALHESLLQLQRRGLSLRQAVDELKELRKQHKSLAKELERAKSNLMKQTAKNREMSGLKRTFAWRLAGKHVYSVEKFIRRILTGK